MSPYPLVYQQLHFHQPPLTRNLRRPWSIQFSEMFCFPCTLSRFQRTLIKCVLLHAVLNRVVGQVTVTVFALREEAKFDPFNPFSPLSGEYSCGRVVWYALFSRYCLWWCAYYFSRARSVSNIRHLQSTSRSADQTYRPQPAEAVALEADPSTKMLVSGGARYTKLANVGGRGNAFYCFLTGIKQFEEKTNADGMRQSDFLDVHTPAYDVVTLRRMSLVQKRIAGNGA